MNDKTYRRIPYIDNVRILCVLLLIPFHSAYIFNALGETFYINGRPSEALNAVDVCIFPWWMSGLFVLAGMSSRYALRKRTFRQFALERVKRLLVPLLVGIIIVIPPQCYFADKFHNGYEGNYLEHYKTYFSVGDFSGYDGKFTPANAWFILYLFVISMIFIPLMMWYKKSENKFDIGKIPIVIIMVLVLLIPCFENIVNIGGKSVALYGYCFFLGYFVFSEEEIQKKLERNSIWLGMMWIISMVMRQVAHSCDGLWDSAFSYVAWFMVTCFGILGMLGLGRKFLNKKMFFTDYLSRAEFAVFLIHQTVVVTIGYYIVSRISNPIFAWITIVMASFVVTFAIYEVIKRNKVTRFMFSIK